MIITTLVLKMRVTTLFLKMRFTILQEPDLVRGQPEEHCRGPRH
jgi:hypothetical protein